MTGRPCPARQDQFRNLSTLSTQITVKGAAMLWHRLRTGSDVPARLLYSSHTLPCDLP